MSAAGVRTAAITTEKKMKKSGSVLILMVVLLIAGNPVQGEPEDQSPSAEGPKLESILVCSDSGSTAASAGDVNGDGYFDAIVGVPHGQLEENEGAAYLFSGSPYGLRSRPLWLDGSQSGSGFGYSVASAGDVNGDGYSDVIVGAYDRERGGRDRGAAFIYLGSTRGLNVDPLRLEGDQAGSGFGWSVASAGDVNGDGFSDVLVGAPFYESDAQEEGSVFLYLGSASGLDSEPLRLDGVQTGSGFGWSIASAGDINGDGYSDIIVGAPRYDGSQSDEGVAFLYLGSKDGLQVGRFRLEVSQAGAGFGFSVAPVGDIDGDGYADFIVGAPYYDNGQPDEGAAFLYLGSSVGLNYAPVWMEAEGEYAGFGWSVASAGDVNKDGYGDVLVGAPRYAGGEGAAFLFRGSSSGLAGVQVITGDDRAGSGFGWSVASAGDVDGDGYGDILIGSCGRENNGSRIYFYPRGKSGLSVNIR